MNKTLNKNKINAEDLNWEPIYKGGAALKSVSFNLKSEHRIEGNSSKRMLVFMVIIGYLGFSLTKFGALNFSSSFIISGISFLIGLPMFLLGVASLIEFFFWIRVIDKQMGLYWYGWKWKSNPDDILSKDHSCRLQDILAIQVLGKCIKSSDASPDLRCYELNLYLNNNQRHMLTNQGHLESLMVEANKIADFLEVPVFTNVEVKTSK